MGAHALASYAHDVGSSCLFMTQFAVRRTEHTVSVDERVCRSFGNTTDRPRVAGEESLQRLHARFCGTVQRHNKGTWGRPSNPQNEIQVNEGESVEA